VYPQTTKKIFLSAGARGGGIKIKKSRQRLEVEGTTCHVPTKKIFNKNFLNLCSVGFEGLNKIKIIKEGMNKKS
jgi:hypothetical protein